MLFPHSPPHYFILYIHKFTHRQHKMPLQGGFVKRVFFGACCVQRSEHMPRWKISIHRAAPSFFPPGKCVSVYLVTGDLCNVFHIWKMQYKKSLASLSPAEGALWGPGRCSPCFFCAILQISHISDPGLLFRGLSPGLNSSEEKKIPPHSFPSKLPCFSVL